MSSKFKKNRQQSRNLLRNINTDGSSLNNHSGKKKHTDRFDDLVEDPKLVKKNKSDSN